jgi:DNA repair photolyase
MSFWEPNAPSYEERKKSLMVEYEEGFHTSVSVEPMLDSANIESLVGDLLPFINDALWNGKMNHISDIRRGAGNRLERAIRTIEANQTDDKIREVYDLFKDNPKIKWKENIKKVVGIEPPPAQGMDI